MAARKRQSDFGMFGDLVCRAGGSQCDVDDLASPQGERFMGRVAAEWIRTRRTELLFSPTMERESRRIVVVPNLSCADLMAAVREQLPGAVFDPTYDDWDFVGRDAGQQFRWIAWQPNRYVTTEEHDQHFETTKFHGNIAALVAWAMKYKPIGWFVTIPPPEFLPRQRDSRYVSTMCYRNDAGSHRFDLDPVAAGWQSQCVHLAFQHVTPRASRSRR